MQYDYTYMLKDAVKVNGVSEKQLVALAPKLKAANKKFSRDFDEDYMAFHRLPDENKRALAIKYAADRLSQSFENLIVIGIGGSDLGARAVIGALTSPHHNELPNEKRGGMRIYFAGDTTDPTPLEDLLTAVDLKKTAVHVVSKSGNTIETMSAFMIIREKLIEAVGQAAHHRHIVATTSPDSGRLIELVEKEGYTLLPHGVVGGRFSVLSEVGLLAVACAGIDIDGLLRGASSMKKLLKANSVKTNPAFAFAALNYLAFTKNQQNISVLMPYEYRLKTFGAWYRQLWAESLGKNGLGQTPVAALGPTDQHSQLQLYQDGPTDKTITFIAVEKQLNTKTPKIEIAGIEYFSNIKLSMINRLELEATALALVKGGKPNGTIILPELSAKTIGQLIYFFELATAYSGELYGIDAFNQPGVELSKQYLHAELGNSELVETKKELTKLEKSFKRKISG